VIWDRSHSLAVKAGQRHRRRCAAQAPAGSPGRNPAIARSCRRL